MTIKRRLFISNIMMLVIPVILSIMIVWVMMLAMLGVFGMSVFDWFSDGEEFGRVTSKIQSLTDKWSHGANLDQITADVERLELRFGEVYSSISLAVYQNGECLYTAGNFTDNPLLTVAVSEHGNNSLIMNNICVNTYDIGVYKIILVESDYKLHDGIDNPDNRNFLRNLIGVLFVFLIVIILATNRFLTRIVVKSIITPLDALVYGVHQIRDGNLNYRIEYAGNDEFKPVCSDFNEMAERLLDMVDSRQRDEENRKELIAGISHDLRTPLTSIKTYVEGIEIGLASSPQIQKRYLETIKSKTKDLEHIINQLFLLSKLDIGEFPMQFQPLDIGTWLSDFIGKASEEYHDLKIDLTENIHGEFIKADSVQLGNVLTNILENSLKYCGKEQANVRISCKTIHSGVVITMSDNGPGVADDTLDKLFQIFYRGDKARSNTGQGSGLGLAISAKIIERHGGSIKAANLPEGGLSMRITLPVVKGEQNK